MKKGNVIKVIRIKVGADPVEVLVENELSALQALVGGPIEVVTPCADLAIVCNEEGRLLGLPRNCRIMGTDYVGDIFLCGIDGDEFTDMPLSLELVTALGVIRR